MSPNSIIEPGTAINPTLEVDTLWTKNYELAIDISTQESVQVLARQRTCVANGNASSATG